MDKPKYDKPTAKDLSSVSVAHGSCLTGAPEDTMTNCAANGEIALGRCGPGGTVYPFTPCENGSSAGGGCVNGYGAG